MRRAQKFVAKFNPNSSTQNLKLDYLNALEKMQPEIPSHQSEGVILLDDEALETELIQAFLGPSILNDLPQYADKSYFQNDDTVRDEIRASQNYIANCMDKFANSDPQFWQAFALYVNFLFSTKSSYSRGGSDSRAIGTLFFSNALSYSQADLYELLVHEFSHTVMFIDEQINPHYEDELLMAEAENFAIGAITNLKRPLDKTLHSAVVATEVLLHRMNNPLLYHDATPRTIHAETQSLCAGILRSIESMRKPPHVAALLSERGHSLLDMCSNAVAKYAH